MLAYFPLWGLRCYVLPAGQKQVIGGVAPSTMGRQLSNFLRGEHMACMLLMHHLLLAVGQAGAVISALLMIFSLSILPFLRCARLLDARLLDARKRREIRLHRFPESSRKASGDLFMARFKRLSLWSQY